MTQINQEINWEANMYQSAVRSTVKVLINRAKKARAKSLSKTANRKDKFALENFAEDLEENFAKEFLNQLPNPDIFENIKK